MSDRPKFFDDLAGVAGGALSALAGLREEAEAMVRARIDETIRKLELVRKEELDAMSEMAANARAGQEAAEATLRTLADRVAVLEARVAALETAPKPHEESVSGATAFVLPAQAGTQPAWVPACAGMTNRQRLFPSRRMCSKAASAGPPALAAPPSLPRDIRPGSGLPSAHLRQEADHFGSQLL